MEADYIKLAQETEICKKCTNLVIGKGNLKAKILFVGEAPGRNEDEQGLPFVGAAGKNLDKLLAKTGLSLDDIYVTNILKCRPPENRDPLPDEVRAHTPWLVTQIKEMKPLVICSLGNHATKFFLAGGDVSKMADQEGITKVHGVPRTMTFEGLSIRLVPLFHPAAIIYNQSLLAAWEKDMEVVKAEVARTRS